MATKLMTHLQKALTAADNRLTTPSARFQSTRAVSQYAGHWPIDTAVERLAKQAVSRMGPVRRI